MKGGVKDFFVRRLIGEWVRILDSDFDSGSLIFRDYWNYNLDLDVSDIKSNGKNKVMKFFSKLKLRS